MARLITRLVKKLRGLIVKVIPFNSSFRPSGIYATFNEYVSCHKGRRPNYMVLYPAHESTLGITDSFIKICSSCLRHHLTVPVPPSSIVEVANGRLYTDTISNVSVISGDNKLIGEASFQFGQQNPENNQLFRQRYFTKPRKYSGTAFQILIGGSGDDNYFHWLFDALPRIHFLQKSGWFDRVDWFVVPSYKHGYQQDTLRLLGIGKDKIIEGHEETHIQADVMIASSYARHGEHIPAWVCDFLRKSFSDLVTSDMEAASHIYISRSDSGSRVVVNEAELFAILDEYGFQKVTLSNLSFLEQVKVFASAKFIVAPHGAGLANLVFCEKGTTVVELFADGYVLPLYYDLATKVGVNYNYLVCQEDTEVKDVRQAMKLNISVDLSKFKTKMEQLLDVGVVKYLISSAMVDVLMLI